MAKTYIGFATHWYQPPIQRPEVIQQVVEECYLPIIKASEKSQLFLSIDMAQSLGEKLPQELMQTLCPHYTHGLVEFINTLAYHYFLPLMPQPVVARQLHINNAFYQKSFGVKNVSGLFPPELGVSPAIYRMAHNLNYSWLIADDELFRLGRIGLPEYERVPKNWIPLIDGCGVLLRSRLWSNIISTMKYPDERKVTSGNQLFQELLRGQEQWREACRNQGDSYIIIALDAETFGHHHKGAIENIFIPFFEEANKNQKRCSVVPLNTIFKNFSKITVHRNIMASGSWSTSKEDINRGIFFPLWNSPDNQYHRAWNRFKNEVFRQIEFPNSNPELQKLLDTAFYSCSPWWATKDNPKDKKIAGWCLPMFKRIMELTPPEIKQTLFEPYRVMNDFVEHSD